jgi:hypothetical protein
MALIDINGATITPRVMARRIISAYFAGIAMGDITRRDLDESVAYTYKMISDEYFSRGSTEDDLREVKEQLDVFVAVLKKNNI